MKRFARIYPVHLLTLLALLALVLGTELLGATIGHDDQFTVGGFLAELFLVRAWWGDALVWNIPAWSVSAEWLAYLVFPAIVIGVAAVSARRSTPWILCALLLTTGGVTAALWPSLNHMPFPVVRVLIGVTLGICIQRFVRDRRPSAHAGRMAMVSLVALVVVSSVDADDPTLRGLRAGAVIALSGTTIALLAVARGRAVSWLGHRTFERGGRISYSLYLVHLLALMAVARVLAPDRFVDQPLAVRLGLVAVALAAMLAAAAAMYALVEEPGRRWILRVHARSVARRRRDRGPGPTRASAVLPTDRAPSP